MQLSYWEYNTWLNNIDFAVVGSGIVGLSCALSLRDKYPDSKIVVFEKGVLPNGASTKNAGFACFGSLSEILEDLKSHTEEEVLQLVEDRVRGLELLRGTIGDKILRYQGHGGYELFMEADRKPYHASRARLEEINALLRPIFPAQVFSEVENTFQFRNIVPKLIYNRYEGQIDPGTMMCALLQKASEANIPILNATEVTHFAEASDGVQIQINHTLEVSVGNLFIATNGFAGQLLEEQVKPARAQVIITRPIHGLSIKGTFHMDKGYYYFRNVGKRLLFGGARNLDFKAEETTEMGSTELVQNTLEEILRTTILPESAFEIESRWSGIMGVGPQKKPIIRHISDHVFCGIRLGGMGIAIGSSVGKQLADLV